MAILFYVLGWLGLIIGGAWAAITLTATGSALSALQDRTTEGLATALAGLLVAGPGFGMMSGGLLLLAIGGGLARLDKLIRIAQRNGTPQNYQGDTRRWSARDRARMEQQQPEPQGWTPPQQ